MYFFASYQLLKTDIYTEAAEVYYASVCCLSDTTLIISSFFEMKTLDEYKLQFLSLLLEKE